MSTNDLYIIRLVSWTQKFIAVAMDPYFPFLETECHIQKNFQMRRASLHHMSISCMRVANWQSTSLYVNIIETVSDDTS